MKNGHDLAGRFLGVVLVIIAFLISGCGPEIKDEISATGTVEMTETTVSCKTGGRVLGMFFEEGQTVEAGALMAELDHDQLSAQIKAARSGLEVAQANLNAARRDLNRIRQLRRAEIISQSEYDRAVTNWEIHDAQVKQAEANLKLLEVQLKEARVFAPARGVVSAKLVEPGEVVAPGASLYTILDYAKPWVKIYLPLLEVERVNLNQKAIITLDAFPGKEFTGRIAAIAQEAEFTPKDYLSKEERVKQVYEVKVELDNASGLLKAGVPVEVKIEGSKPVKNR